MQDQEATQAPISAECAPSRAEPVHLEDVPLLCAVQESIRSPTENETEISETVVGALRPFCDRVFEVESLLQTPCRQTSTGKENEIAVEVESKREGLTDEKEEEEAGGKEISEARQVKAKTQPEQALYKENMKFEEEQRVEGEIQKCQTEEMKQGSKKIEKKEEGNTEMLGQGRHWKRKQMST